ncbi:putative choline dehydrogenase [Neofusicoccum parvum]|nr:putative choline dehydrogenase [Neofusicoccum parvum]
MVAHSQLGRNAQIIGRDTALQDEYDFVIIGGGTSGLTVADRLTEDADVSVLVLEFGPFDGGEANVLVPGLAANAYAPYSFNLTSTPQKGLANKTFPVLAAAVVGGGTVVNGMFFDRGGAPDYDAWEQLGNPGWGWAGLLPYFRKSETFTPTNESFAEEWDVSWDLSVHGSSGPVQSRYPPFMWQNIIANPILPDAGTWTSNETYASEQLALYYSSREGPYTLGRGQTVCFLPLQNITNSDKFDEITSLARSTNASSAYSSRNIPAIVEKGYSVQKDIILDLYSSLDTSVKESSFGGAGTMAIVMVKPLSRGTVLAGSTDPLAKPVIDYGTMTAPSDIKIMMASVRKVREFMATPAMSELQPTELVPGANLTTDAQLEPALRGAMQPTFAHVCCTAPMMAREDGGVLDPELRVHAHEFDHIRYCGKGGRFD